MDWLTKFHLEPHACKTIQVGQRFGRITVLATGKLPGGGYKYRTVYQCDCGTVGVTQNGSIQIGTTRSCGCKNRDDTTKHGLWSHPLYVVWRHMMERCYDEQCPAFKNYGGRGIRVCKRWHDLRKFHADMSPTYAEGLTLDREDNNKGYSPENCRWETRATQSANRRNCINVTIDGKTQTLKEWARDLGVNYHSAYHRVTKMGWEPELALRTPFLTKTQARVLARPS